LTVYTREQLAQRWATTQNNLGIALQSQGERQTGEEGVSLLGQAVEAYREALTVFTREQLPQQWATTQNNLGIALRSQSERMAGEEGVRLLGQAVEAYRQALTVYTREQLPQDWAMTQNNLARAYYLLKDWANSARCYQNALTLYPDYKQAYQRVSYITHEVIFSFAESFELKQRWLERHSDDLSAQADFAENHFTTARFVEFEQRIAALLTNPKLDVSPRAGLRMIEIANLLALGKAELVPGKLDELIEVVSGQPADFKITWTFNGTPHFIGKHEKLATHREWLSKFFGAAQGENREALLKALRESRAAFRK
jgi:tetratricopeptide (TPR) repeat protein